MRILQIITRNEMRGAEIFAGRLSDALSARGHSTGVAALYNDRPRTTGSLRLARSELMEIRGRHNGTIEPATLRRLGRVIRTFRPDVVQANAFHALRSCALLRALGSLNVPLVYRNVSIASRWVRGPFSRTWGRWLVQRVDIVLSVGRAGADDFARTYGIARDRIRTVHRGVDIPRNCDRDAQRARLAGLLNIPADGTLMFHLGGFTDEKNHKGLLDAFELILQRHPDVRLVMLGDGPLREPTERRIAGSRLTGRAFCTGYRADARVLLAAADILLLPSHIEGVPGAALEAGACRVPVVATNVGAVNEVIEHDRTGLLVDAGDMASFAEQTCRLLDDPSLRSELGHGLHEVIIRDYGMRQSVDQFESVYRELVMANRAALGVVSSRTRERNPETPVD